MKGLEQVSSHKRPITPSKKERLIKSFLRGLLFRLYRVRVVGLENVTLAGERVLIIANHTSFIDGPLLAAFLPGKLTFAVHTQVSQRWYTRIARLLVDLFPIDPTSPLATKALINYLRRDRRAVIFPEGRITVTGSLMKIYQGPGLVADKSGAMVLPVRIEGAQYSPFSRLRGRVRIRWFPRITLTVLSPRRLDLPENLVGQARRRRAGQLLTDLMTEMMFSTGNYRRTLFAALLDAIHIHGGRRVVLEDVQRKPLSYNQLLRQAMLLGRAIYPRTEFGEAIGVMLPSAISTVALLLGLQVYGRVPAMLNFTSGIEAIVTACRTARLKTVCTSRRFVGAARLERAVEALSRSVNVIYLEDLAGDITLPMKLKSAAEALFAKHVYRRHCTSAAPDEPAIILFTSGSEASPKGVVLSHANLLANREQLAARVDFSAQDVILNALPMFHSFGLTAGTILPLLSGMKAFFYPSPLHYRIVPEIAYDINATILFGTNTFLAGYARSAHPYDFYSLRYVFAGAEKLQEDVRRKWEEKFGVRVFEGYGATETGPVLAVNTAMNNRPGTVGRFLPGIEYWLERVPGVRVGARLQVRGPNVMLGYLLPENPGALVSPRTPRGTGWYDTGDIVSIDEDGFVTICGRAKRFAKVGGEMVSLAAVEALAVSLWSDATCAAIAVPDVQRGEQIVLVTDEPGAGRSVLAERARTLGLSDLSVPKRVVIMEKVPLLGTGKIDYVGIQEYIGREVAL